MTRNFLILTSGVGDGHNIAARSLAEYLGMNGFDFIVVDYVDFSLQGKLNKYLHRFITHHIPILGKMIFYATDYSIFSLIRKTYTDSFSNYDKFEKLIDDNNITDVILTQKSWIPYCEYYIQNNGKNFTYSLVVTLPRFIHFLRKVKSEFIDNLFVIDISTKEEITEKFQIEPDKITVSFHPLSNNLFKSKNNIDPSKILLLLTGLQEVFLIPFLDFILKNGKFNVKIVKGRNDELYQKLKNIYEYENVFEFYEYIDLGFYFHQVNGIYIGKPGGALMSECIATDTPMLMPNFFAGEESGSKEFIEDYGLGIYEPDPKKMFFLLQYLNYGKILSNFSYFKEKNSCETIINTILG